MTNISKNKLPKKSEVKLFSQFTKLFAVADEKLLADMFEALFTEAEKIMFIKRLAIILLLSRKCSNYRISKTLHISDSTVRDIKQKFLKGHYDVLVKSVNNKKFDTKKFWTTVEVLLSAGLPPRGRGRWKWLYK